MCVQRFDDSLNSANHITYRISLRSSSMPEPRDPLLKVLNIISYSDSNIKDLLGPLAGTNQPRPVVVKQACQGNKDIIDKGWRYTLKGMFSVTILRKVTYGMETLPVFTRVGRSYLNPMATAKHAVALGHLCLICELQLAAACYL